MNAEKTFILAIETAVEGGSLAILKGETEIASWSGSGEVSKAEDVLEQTSELLKKNNLSKTNIAKIAVSNGPGSSTGIKIGLALARGLSQSLVVQMVEVPIHDALLDECGTNSLGTVVTILPVGKNLIGWQIFKNKIPFFHSSPNEKLADKSTSTVEEFGTFLNKYVYDQLVFHKKAFDRCANLNTEMYFRFSPVVSEKNIAYLIGKKSV